MQCYILVTVLAVIQMSLSELQPETIPFHVTHNLDTANGIQCKHHSPPYQCHLHTVGTQECMIWGSPLCYEGSVDLLQCNNDKRALSSPFQDIQTFELGENAFVKPSVDICIVQDTFIAWNMVLYINSLFLENNTVGPSAARGSIKTAAKAKLREKIVDADAIFSEEAIDDYLECFVMPLHYFTLLYRGLYNVSWEPSMMDVRGVVHRMGGCCVSFDWTFKCLKHIRDWIDPSVFDDEKEEKVGFETESESESLYDEQYEEDGADNYEHPKYRNMTSDQRKKLRSIDVAVLVLMNHWHFIISSKPTPRKSESHVYLVPELAQGVYALLSRAEKTPTHMLYKSDGLLNAVEVPEKTTALMMNWYGPKAGTVDLLSFNAVSEVAVDGLHRDFLVVKKRIVSKKDPEILFVTRARAAISKQCDYERKS
eukprot:21474_1